MRIDIPLNMIFLDTQESVNSTLHVPFLKKALESVPHQRRETQSGIRRTHGSGSADPRAEKALGM